MSHAVVSISSQDGAGAHEIAPLVAESLRFRLIDEEIVTRAALEAGVHEKEVVDVERRKSTLVRLIEGLGTAGMGAGYVVAPGYSPSEEYKASEELRGLIRAAIEETAAAGSAVIASHAASLALGQRDDVLRVFLTASTDARERRVAEEAGIDAKEAARVIKRSDRGRADYIKRFYGVGQELPTHYDLTINTDRLSPKDAAALIVHAAGSCGS